MRSTLAAANYFAGLDGFWSSLTVFDLLLHLIENRERVVSRDDLLAAVWKGRIVS